MDMYAVYAAVLSGLVVLVVQRLLDWSIKRWKARRRVANATPKIIAPGAEAARDESDPLELRPLTLSGSKANTIYSLASIGSIALMLLAAWTLRHVWDMLKAHLVMWPLLAAAIAAKFSITWDWYRYTKANPQLPATLTLIACMLANAFWYGLAAYMVFWP